MVVQAMTRGVASFFTGSVPSARIALICSVTTMEPNSEAMPDPARPASIKAVSTGPISRINDREINCPIRLTAPNALSDLEVCRARTPPVKKPTRTTIRIERTPIVSICWNVSWM